jgi:hypothetical protein
MARNQLITDLAAEAKRLGWSPPDDLDHVEYVYRALRAMHTFAEAGDADGWLVHAYSQEYRDLNRSFKTRWEPLIPPGDGSGLLALALEAPAIWAAEVALLANGRRRTGQAQKLIGSCRRIQLSMVRHGVDSVGRWGERATPIRDDVRARGLFLLARGTEREEEDWSLFWGVAVAGADARTTTREYATGAGDGGPGELDDDAMIEGWEAFGDGR